MNKEESKIKLQEYIKLLTDDFKGKYDNCKNNHESMSELRLELCKFFDNFLIITFDTEFFAIRREVSFAITDFIELVEYNENKASNEIIINAEKSLFEKLNRISNNI